MPPSRLRRLVAVLLVVHAAVLGAGLLAPYDPATQHRDFPFAPPSRIRVLAADGRWHLPFVYRLVPRSPGSPGYLEDVSRRFPVRWLVAREPAGATTSAGWRLAGVEPPAHLFLLGTDRFGRDQLSRLLHGARVSLLAGLAATALTLFIGLTLGTLAGYVDGLDGPLMRLADLATALPWVYLLLAVRSVFPLDLAPAPALALVVAIIGLVGWARPARLVRSVVLSVRSREFVVAARSLGASHLYLLRRHVVPQTASLLLTQGALLVPQFILAETTLSFLGLGIGEPAPSWGGMLNAVQSVQVLGSFWWMLAPGVALVLTCLLYQALADAVQEHGGRIV